jgi:hypothetical protein
MQPFRIALGLLTLTTPAVAQCPLAKIEASDAAPSAYFGVDVALSGGRMLVGASFADGVAPNAGAAYVLSHNGTGWVEDARLTAADGQTLAYFGECVDLDGNTALVGAYVARAAYVFEEQAGVWTQTAKLQALDGTEEFGLVTALDGDTVVVGASRDDQLAMDAGAAYVFQRGPGGWVQTQKLFASDGKTGDQLGVSLAIEGDRLFVGALSGDGAVVDSGTVYVFERSAGSWSEVQKLSAPDVKLGDQFGSYYGVALDGDRALIGARRTDEACPLNPNCMSGSAYVFERLGGSWVQTAKLNAPTPQAFAVFGCSVALDGERALIGSWTDGASQQGRAYVYDKSAFGWLLRGVLDAPDAQAYDQFGQVALDGDLAVVSASREDGLSENEGAVYTFSVLEQGCPSLLGVPEAISLAVGGTQKLLLDAGPGQAFAVFAALGSLSGTSPGVVVDGLLLPLQIDSYLQLTLSGGGPLLGSPGYLDGGGRAQATVAIPAGSAAALAGVTAHHAFLTLDLSGSAPVVGFTSAAQGLTLEP